MRPLANDLVLGTMPNGSPLRLTREQRARHLYAVGSTGSGKSKLFEGMIRQDILAWPASRSPVIVFDKHGELFDGLMAWIAASGLRHLPIVPIDLRRGDWIVSYNVLRHRPGANSAVIAGEVARAIVHAWGQDNMDETPRLAKWLSATLGTLYERGDTLADSLALLASPSLRRAMTADVKGFASRRTWEIAETLRPWEFHEEVASTFNRLLRFLDNQVIRASLCQPGESLDLGAAIAKGSIILVCLATGGTQVDAEDARAFGTMLLSDLWLTSRSRGVSDGRSPDARPIYCYVDEFQDFVTPAMAATLDQARKFGLHMSLAQQFPSQLIGQGPLGKLVFDSVMVNTRTKIVFQLDHPDDLPTLALWLGRNEIDIDEVKHQHYTTKVLGHHLSYLPSFGESENETDTESWQESHTDGNSESHSTQWSTSRSRGGGTSHGSGVSESARGSTEDGNDVRSSSVSESDGEFSSEQTSESYGESDGYGTSSSDTSGTGGSVARGRGRSTTWSPMLIPLMGQEASPPQFRSIEEQQFRITQQLAGQRDREAVVRLAGTSRTRSMTTRTVMPAVTTRPYIEKKTVAMLGGLPYALPMDEAMRRMDEREASRAEALANPPAGSEPTTYSRKIPSRIVPSVSIDSPCNRTLRKRPPNS
jgi:hypothetical protein